MARNIKAEWLSFDPELRAWAKTVFERTDKEVLLQRQRDIDGELATYRQELEELQIALRVLQRLNAVR